MEIPEVAQAFIDSAAWRFVDNGRAPRWNTDYGYERKIGIVNHIPVCYTLAQLTAYFNGGAAVGSTQMGIGRDLWGHLEWQGHRIPVAAVHQYMPIKRTAQYPNGCSPWAQGWIERSAACPTPPTPAIAGMAQGIPNGAFYSIENVAWTGSDGVTEPQFNANVLARVYLGGLDDIPVSELTHLWHAEIDQASRCFDPGWPAGLEDEMQEATRLLLEGSLAGLRGVQGGSLPPPPPPKKEEPVALTPSQQQMVDYIRAHPELEEAAVTYHLNSVGLDAMPAEGGEPAPPLPPKQDPVPAGVRDEIDAILDEAAERTLRVQAEVGEINALVSRARLKNRSA